MHNPQDKNLLHQKYLQNYLRLIASILTRHERAKGNFVTFDLPPDTLYEITIVGTTAVFSPREHSSEEELYTVKIILKPPP